VRQGTAGAIAPRCDVTAVAGEERKYLLPTGTYVVVQSGQEVYPGDSLARIPRAMTKMKDITGGLPRVVELFEARHPRDKVVITPLDGTVHHGPLFWGMRRIMMGTGEGTRHDSSVRRSVYVRCRNWSVSAPC
jgi:DNA-directed RNA polymerase subunit beta'